VARDWCVVIHADDARSAKRLRDRLTDDAIAAERSGPRIYIYADDRRTAAELGEESRRSLSNAGLDQALPQEISLRQWDEARHRYVDPSRPDIDPDTGRPWDYPGIDPADVRWAVHIRALSTFNLDDLRDQLQEIDRPLLVSRDVFLLGALDEDDAEALAARIRRLHTVGEITTSALGWWARWRLRWQLGGNYGAGGDGG
jgi:hypothetical protein